MKKYKDLTLEEMNNICKKQRGDFPCQKCNLNMICGYFGNITNEELEKEIDIYE